MSNFFLTTPINVPVGATCDITKVARHIGLHAEQILSFSLNKRSVDARDKSNVRFVCSFVVECTKTPKRNATPYVEPQDLLQNVLPTNKRGSCVVVGGGPSGLFLARYLTEMGVNVTVVERGSDVVARQKAVNTFFQGGQFDVDTNVQFGLGGAGTFSDGKLTTGISSPLVNTVFREFVRCGAPTEILTSAMPHIGTDNLVNVVANLRDRIVEKGGKFLFNTSVNSIIVRNGVAVGVETSAGTIFADCVALCCGHSARDLFYELRRQGVAMTSKPFAVGLRIEHTREFINTAQYGALFATHRDLGAATYKLVHNLKERSCYSFCMCPGGVVVPSNSEYDSVVVNGMSNFARDAANSNSALVVSVTPRDLEQWGYGNDVFCGVDFQRKLEQNAYSMGGGNYVAPCQNVTDFLANKTSTQFDITPSYCRGVTSANLRKLLPQPISQALTQSLEVFNRKINGFAENGVLTAVETRTSSPVKILRDTTTFQSNVTSLYPVGEGAGYAGGIVSSAVDGLKIAQAIAKHFVK